MLGLVQPTPALSINWALSGYPPELTHAPDAPEWATRELHAMGPMGLVERGMLGGILLVVGLWIFGSRFTDATGAAILGVVLLVACRIVTWDDVAGNRQAWSVFVWFAGHTAALLPIFLFIATGPLDVSPRAAALGLGFTLGLMGILTPHAAGPAPVYYTCGYIRKRDFWWFGLVMGSIFLGCYLLIGLPWLLSRA